MDLIISSIREEVAGVKTFALAPVSGGLLTYKAGQFLTFRYKAYGRELRRSYSLSSAPGVHDIAAITVKRVANGMMSRWLIDRASTGDVLHSDGDATGIFTLPAGIREYDVVWLFAAGIGITPIFSLLEELLHHSGMRVVLLYSNHSREETVFYGALRELEQTYQARLRIVWFWSDTQDLRRARLSKESFPTLLRENLTDDPARALCYVCGPGGYMWLVQLLLQDAGVPPEQIRREVFVIDKAVTKYLPADKGTHQVTVHAGDMIYQFVSAYPESILASAKAAGISLPFSCESGQCGSCTAICTKGKVWMSYNEVLTEKDMAAGRVLTCTGHAVGGDVVLKL